MKALTGLASEWYAPEDKLAEGAEFHINPLTQAQLAEVQNHYDQVNGYMKPTGYYLAFNIGCDNWRGVTDMDGKDFHYSAFNRTKVPLKIAMEVGAQVVNVSVLTEDDVKNS